LGRTGEIGGREESEDEIVTEGRKVGNIRGGERVGN